MTQLDRHTGKDLGQRVPVRAAGRELVASSASEYRLAGVDWDYYSAMTQILRYTHEHPEGFIAHFAWPGDGEWRVLNLWSSDELRHKFFAEVAIDRLSKGIHLLGTVSSVQGVTDVRPVQYEVVEAIFGPGSRAFAAIGEDRDGSAIGALGGEPVAIELEVSGMNRDEYSLLVETLGYRTAVPEGLISHHAVIDDHGIRMFESWRSRDEALEALNGLLLPAIERVGELSRKELPAFHREYELKRISLAPKAVEAFGF